MEEIIKKQQKEIDFLNMRLDTAIFIGKHNRIRIEEGLKIRTEIVNELKALANFKH
jgi:hypothetical protein